MGASPQCDLGKALCLLLPAAFWLGAGGGGHPQKCSSLPGPPLVSVPPPLHPSLILPSLSLPLPLCTPCPDWTPSAAQRSEVPPPTATGRNGSAGESGQSQAGREEAGRVPGCGAARRGKGCVSGWANESEAATDTGVSPRVGVSWSLWVGWSLRSPREGGTPHPAQMGQVQIHQEGSLPDGARLSPGSPGQKVVLPLEAASSWGALGLRSPRTPTRGPPSTPGRRHPPARQSAITPGLPAPEDGCAPPGGRRVGKTGPRPHGGSHSTRPARRPSTGPAPALPPAR